MLLSQTPALSPVKSADNKTEKRRQAKLKDDERLEELSLAIARSFSFCGLSVTPELYKLVDCEGEHRPGNQDKFNQPAQRNTPSEMLLCWLRDFFPGQDAVARGFGKDVFRNVGGFFFVRKMAHAAKENNF